MSSKLSPELLRTVSFRLTLQFVLLFSGLALAVFLAFHGYLRNRFGQELDAEALADAHEYAALYERSGLPAVVEEIDLDSREDGVSRGAVALLAADGHLLASSDLELWPDLLNTARSLKVEAGLPAFVTTQLQDSSSSKRILAYPTAGGVCIVIGRSMADIDENLEAYRQVFFSWMAVMVALGSLLAWGVTRRAMLGVQRVTSTAIAIDSGGLDRRVPVGTEGAEIEQLADAFNNMLARIQTLVDELQQVTHDVAHDLRSPLTRMRGISEMALDRQASPEQSREACATVVEECDRLVDMINTMLEIAETHAMLAATTMLPVDFAELVQSAHELFLPVAEDKDLRFDLTIDDNTLHVAGDRSRLQRVVANIVDNAIKFTPAGGSVSLDLAAVAEDVILTVRDSGIGVAPADLPHLFERFYRADRSRGATGNGLGLSLAKAVVQAHGGRITLESEPDEGTTVRLVLPLAIMTNR